MAKVTSKFQVTIPKALAERFGIQPGHEVQWAAAGESIRLAPKSPGKKPTGCPRTARAVRSGYRASERPGTEARVEKTQIPRLDAGGAVCPWPLSLIPIFWPIASIHDFRRNNARPQPCCERASPTTRFATAADARREAEEMLAQFSVVYPNEQIVRTALRGAAAYQLPWFDAHLWAYADYYGLPELISEDFEHGRLYGSVRAVNPFRPS